MDKIKPNRIQRLEYNTNKCPNYF